MIVVDASAIVDLVIDSTRRPMVAQQLLSADEVFAPELLHVEVSSALWRLNRSGALTDGEATQAMNDALDFPIELVSHLVLGRLAWDLRHHLRVADAYYVALAQQLGASLLTADLRLARAARGLTVIAIS